MNKNCFTIPPQKYVYAFLMSKAKGFFKYIKQKMSEDIVSSITCIFSYYFMQQDISISIIYSSYIVESTLQTKMRAKKMNVIYFSIYFNTKYMMISSYA
jgi:hypothetical protein